MPYTKTYFPYSMKNLAEEVRNKAIEITNRLLDEGFEEGRAISIGISQAKEWFDNRGDDVSSEITHHLVPYDNRWALKEEQSNDPILIFQTKDAALYKIKELVNEYDYKVMIHDENGRFQRVY